LRRTSPARKDQTVGSSPNPTPYEEGPPKEHLEILEAPLTNRLTPQAPKIRGEGEVGGAVELDGVPSSEKAVFPRPSSTFLNFSQGRIEELTSLLSELSGTPLTAEITCIWLGLESHSQEIPHDSQIKK